MVEKNKGFQIFAHVLMVFLSLCCLAPFFLLIMSSVTAEDALIANGYSFFPAEFSVEAYRYILTDSTSILSAYGLSFLVTIVGTICNLALTTLYAYPLSRKELPGRQAFAFFLFFTMLFSGGLVPSYIMWTRTFHISNTIFALLIPNLLMGAFNVIMMRTYFTSNNPDAVIEAARIDGANEFRILRSVVFPMAMPIIATLVVLVGLAYWNDWTNAQYYISDSRMLSVQALLNRMVQDIQALLANSSANSGSLMQTPQVSIRMAIAFVAMIPILILYPFLQKYFADGIMLGAVKG